MMKNFRNSICAGLALLLVLLTVCGCGKKNEYNIFSEFAKVADDTILPRNVTYGQTLEAFMQERNLTEEDILVSRDFLVAFPYTAEHIPYEIREAIYYIEDTNEIYMVLYTISVKEDDAEEAFAAFYEQAKAVMPAPTQDIVATNLLENIKTGETVSWSDKDGNSLMFSSPETGDAEDTIVVNISMRSGLYPTRAQQENLNPSA